MFDGLPLDLGCGWLHSAMRNPLAMWPRSKRQALDRSRGAWRRQLRNIHLSPSPEQRAAWTAFQQLGERLHPIHRERLRRRCAWRPRIAGGPLSMA